MWTCKQCDEQLEDQFESCWKCSAPKDFSPSAPGTAADAQEPEPPKQRLEFRMFRGTWVTWEDLFREATAFADEIGPDRVVNVSHSVDPHSEGVVVVWYLTCGREYPPTP